jgi:hypothetical protein
VRPLGNLLAKQAGTYDQSRLATSFSKSGCWIRLISDPESAATSSRSTPKRCRVDTEKLQKAVAKEFAAKREQKAIKPKDRKPAGLSRYSDRG